MQVRLEDRSIDQVSLRHGADAYTYEDAATACHVSPETIRRRARAGKLRHGPANGGKPLTVLMTAAEIEANKPGAAKTGEAANIDAGVIRALTEQTALLREQLSKAENAAARAEQSAEQARRMGDRDRATAAEERTRFLSTLEGLVAEVTYLRALHSRYVEAEPVTSRPRPGLLSRLIRQVDDKARG